MKAFTYLLCFFFSSLTYAQKEYLFDCEVQYYYKHESLKLDTIKTYYINSKDNSYFAYKIPKGTSKFILAIHDNNGLIAKQTFDLDKENQSSIIFKADSAKSFYNPYKYQIENYDFHYGGDTLIKSKTLKKITLSGNNLKRNVRKKIGKLVYLVDTSYDFLPMFDFVTSYEIWKARKNFPSGLLTEFYSYDYKNRLDIELLLKTVMIKDFKIVFL